MTLLYLLPAILSTLASGKQFVFTIGLKPGSPPIGSFSLENIAFSNYLNQVGHQKGDRGFLWGEKRIEWVEAAGKSFKP
ncbi:MAG: hypothetical protein VYC91_02245 [Acidobacteriota bacterium]|nr:hypothetical protein [Acidobacteriota bacterium]